MTFLQRIGAGEQRRFAFLAAWLLAIFMMGGGARDDIASLVLLRPLAVLVLVGGLYKLSAGEARPYRWLLAYVGAIAALTSLHLVPLPPALWQSLPQRELVAQIDLATGAGAVWRPLSIAPPRTWNALFALAVPASVLVLSLRLDTGQLRRMVQVVLVIGFISVLLGILQISGGGGGLYLYAIHNAGSADGLFANRNHQAAFLACLFPLLAAFASARDLDTDQRRFRLIVAASCGLTLVPVLLVTGSRAGIGLGLVGLLASVLVYRPAPTDETPSRRSRGVQQKSLSKKVLMTGFVAISVVLVLLTVILARAESLNRIFKSGEAAEVRAETFQPVLDLFLSYFPFGSGAGTFVEAFFRAEPRDFISPTYLNHAHFDYLEWAVTGGLPAILLVIVGAIALSSAAMRLFLHSRIVDPGVQLGRAGLVVLAIFAAASIFDYPLRTPSISALAALAAVWVWRGTRAAKMPAKGG